MALAKGDGCRKGLRFHDVAVARTAVAQMNTAFGSILAYRLIGLVKGYQPVWQTL